ncbi:MAG: SMI1/KNR4 family protein [Candidatus Thiosymbion ectosymbiont of Robbea hypermnestra]|nr:SMI1/KNR4 family protein [Candidatus Thiosymbion ectosymbiont of Robbea hypermnestra]
MIEYDYQGIPASRDEIAAFERKLGVKLPPAYVAFLTSTNGGQPTPDTFRVSWGNQPWAGFLETMSVGELYGLRDDEGLSLEEGYESMAERIPGEAIPIGNDPGGSLLLLFVKGPFVGQVHIWIQDYEVDFERGEIPDMSNVGFIAEDFAKFLACLSE